MNNITVSDILKLDIMQGNRVVAGQGGLNKPIHYVTVYDNLITELDSKIQVFPGDIYLSTFYHGSRDDGYILELLKQLIEIKASAVVVTDENMTDIPSDAKALCDAHDLPVIFINCETPYALLIARIMEYRITFYQTRSLQDKLALITSPETSAKEKSRLIEEINPNFLQYSTCFFCAEDDEPFLPTDYLGMDNINMLNIFNRNTVNYATTYRNGILIIITYHDNSEFNVSNIVENTIEAIKKYRPNVQIGISNSCIHSELGLAVQQCYTAFCSKVIDEDNISHYRNIGISRILVELNGSDAIESFYHDIMNPLLDYDEHKHTRLVETMLSFVNYDMDYKKTSKALFVHENTIRYRVNLLKELIPYGNSDIDFLETLSIVSKIYKIKEI